MTGAKAKKTRLESWKEVAAFFGRTERTVMRWENERGLPIHRLPGDLRSRISADIEELEAWLRSADGLEPAAAGDVQPAAPSEVRPAEAARKTTGHLFGRATVRTFGLVVILIAATTMAALGLVWISHRFRPAPPPAPPAAQALYTQGMADWARRTPVSLTGAVDEFNNALHIAPDYAKAYMGLANCYNLLSEYTSMPPSQAFPLATEAAEHAVRLDDRLGGAHAALAFSLFYGSWDSARAGREYDRALQLDPGNATTQHWYATYLYTETDFAQALMHINRALELDPTSISIQADRALILYRSGQTAQAKAILEGLEKAQPSFRSPHTYLADMSFFEGRDEDFLRESEIAAQLANDLYGQAAVRAAREGRTQGGHTGMVRALLKARQDQYNHGIGSAFNLAALAAQLNDNALAMTYLKLAFDRHDPDVIYTRLDPRLAPLRGLKAYQDLVAQIHG